MIIQTQNVDFLRACCEQDLLEKHSTNIDGDTLTSIRMITDFLIQIGGHLKFEITKKLIDRCKASRSKYRLFLITQEN